MGSRLGDGYFQKTANGKYKYRESHSIAELEYAAWKYLMLGELTEGTSIISKNNGSAVEIFTAAKASDVIQQYAEMDFNEVLKEMNIYGLIVYLLDDGWYSNHSKRGNFVIGSKKLKLEEKEKIIEKLNYYHIDANIITKRQDISIHSSANKILWAYMDDMMFTRDIDIIHKKFGKIEQQLIC